MRKAWALLLLPAWAAASGGTQVTWLGGTVPYDTVPYLEADPQLLFSAGAGAPAGGAALDAGLTDGWMLQGAWVQPAAGGGLGRVSSRLKLMPQPVAGLGASAFVGALLPQGGATDGFAGLAVAWEGGGHSLAANKTFYAPSKAQSLSFAYWAPYLTFAVRPGLEAGLEDNAAASRTWVLPQLGLNFPGDLSLDLGARFDLDGSGAWRVLTRLSYEIFPSP